MEERQHQTHPPTHPPTLSVCLRQNQRDTVYQIARAARRMFVLNGHLKQLYELSTSKITLNT